jgi:hypothetical protein
MSFTNFSDIARSKNQVVVVTHVATGKTISFPAFITEYNDSYSVTWGEEQIFGRNDPIKPYQSTKRNMQIGFDVLSASFEEARENLCKSGLMCYQRVLKRQERICLNFKHL